MSTVKLTRGEVYYIINGERDYQDKIWNDQTTPSKGEHTEAEFILYMEHYLSEARRIASTTAEGNPDVGAFIRKVTAMGVSCMEQNGAPERGK